MPFQNRVTPLGEIVALPGRGSMLGNRGTIHDAQRRIVRQYASRRWIACVLEFRGRWREVMQPGRWTHLFFLDEATAFSAGHRPCAECRRADYNRFKALWEQHVAAPAGADDMDAILHAQRLERRKKRTWRADIASLPDGTFVLQDGAACIVWGDRVAAWTDTGYRDVRARPRSGIVDVLTPEAIVAVFRGGYLPMVHPSVLLGSLG